MIAPLSIARSLDRTPEQVRSDRLIAALSEIPQEFVLTPTYRKVPVRPGWQNEKLSSAELAELLRNGSWIKREDGSRYKQHYNGLALIIPSGCVVVDIDGRSSRNLLSEISGKSSPAPTVSWSSGKASNGSLLYYLPDELQERMDALPGRLSKIRLTECPTWKTHGSDAIELLLKGSRATLPPSAHPETSGYEFRLGWDYGIQPAPEWVIQAIEAEVAKREFRAANPLPVKDWSDIGVDAIQQALEAIDPDCAHDDWLRVGMALHSAGNESYLNLWEEWSSQGSKYRPGECEKRWASFRSDGGIGLGSLFALAGITVERDRQITREEWRAKGFSLLEGQKRQAEQQKQKQQRDRLISKRMMVFRSNYKQASDKAIYLSDTPESETTWYQGFKTGDPLKLGLTAQTILVGGGLGSGKTESTLRSLAEQGEMQDIWLSGRRNLNLQTQTRAEGLGIETYNYQQDVGLFRQMLRSRQPGLYFFCGAGLSIYHTDNIHWDESIVVIDEFSGVRAEIASAGAEIFREFEKLLGEAGKLICVDAHLSDFDLEVIEMYRAGKSRAIYRQVEQKSDKKISWIECRTKDGLISLSHDGVGFAWAEEALKAGKKIAIPTDHKLTAKAIALHLEKLGYKGILATSETIELNRQLFADPDAMLANPEVQFFIYSPVAQSGLDVQADFDAGLLLYHGIIKPDQALQMMGRCRNCNDWAVSAPRRSLNPTVTFNALTDAKIAQTSADLFDAMAALSPDTSALGVAWGTAQRMLDEVWAAYSSEALLCLLEEKFEAVETVELEADPTLNREYTHVVKNREAQLRLGADEFRGAQLIAKQQEPANDADYWAIEAAKLAEQFPKLWDRCKNFATDPNVTGGEVEAIEIIKVLSSARTSKLYRWVEATVCPDEGLSALVARLGRKSFNPANPNFKRYQNLKLFRVLGLGDLACAGKGAVAHQTHFNIQSPQVQTLYELFRRSPQLVELFPQVETLAEFWAVVRRCMSSMGYQSAGKTIRVASAEAAPNGKNRNGRQRFSKSRSEYFSGWNPMGESGSKLFQALLPELIGAIAQRLEQEYDRTYQADAEPPPEQARAT